MSLAALQFEQRKIEWLLVQPDRWATLGSYIAITAAKIAEMLGPVPDQVAVHGAQS